MDRTSVFFQMLYPDYWIWPDIKLIIRLLLDIWTGIYYAKYYGKGGGGVGEWPAGEKNKNYQNAQYIIYP